MKKHFDFPVVLLFSAVATGITGCGVGIVSAPERSPKTVEEIDPFNYGDEFAFRLKEIAPDTSIIEKVPAEEEVSTPREKKETVPVPLKETVPAPRKEASDSTGKNSVPAAGTPSGKNNVVYRVQIGIFEEQKSAERRAEEARSKVDKEVRIEFEPPFYRVRVGEFYTRKEAEDYVKILQDYGFRGSFWVMKNINTP